ncbi:hypothetical protein MLD38_001353 [Melastoma candidum]|uniref:Uncharacterized protein n=1 Tax=Melastoma candidum TaxID=119954 RepID=A0ACB9SGX1_9MYRT|nr:hypothetical protein MLD38_001353 [Melastoma candidum]
MRLRRRLLGVEKRAGGRVDLVGAVNGKVDNEVRVEIGKLALPEELADAVDGVAGGGAGAKANDHPGLDKVDGFEGGDLLEVVLGEDRGVGVAAGMSGLKREEVSFIGGQSMGYRSCRLGIVWSKMQCLQVAAALSRLRGCRETWRCISEPSVTVGAGNALGSKPAGLSGSRGMRMGLRCRAAKIVGFSAGLDVGSSAAGVARKTAAGFSQGTSPSCRMTAAGLSRVRLREGAVFGQPLFALDLSKKSPQLK